MTVTCNVCHKDFANNGSLRTHRFNYHNKRNKDDTSTSPKSIFDNHYDSQVQHFESNKRSHDGSVFSQPKRKKVAVSFDVFKREMDKIHQQNCDIVSDVKELQMDMEELDDT